MSPESRRRLRLAGFIVGVLYGSAVGLLAGGWQEAILGGGVGLILGSGLSSLLSRLDRIPRRARIGGVVGAALLVAAALLMAIVAGKRSALLWLGATLPIMALGGFFWGMVLSASRARFLLTGALAGALSMPPIVLIAHRVASGQREPATLVAAALVGALLLAVGGFVIERSLSRLWIWAIGGAIIGSLFVMGLYRDTLLFGQPPTSRPITEGEKISIVRFMAFFGAAYGALFGALFGRDSIVPEIRENSGGSND